MVKCNEIRTHIRCTGTMLAIVDTVEDCSSVSLVPHLAFSLPLHEVGNGGPEFDRS